MKLRCAILLAAISINLSLTVATARVSGKPEVTYAYLGCFVDNATQRDLNGLVGLSALGRFTVQANGAVWNNSAMSLGMCSEVCSIGGFGYFAIQSGSFCYCGNGYGAHGVANASLCNRKCTGDNSQICGGAISLSSVYAMTYVYQSIGSLCRQRFGIQSPKQYFSLQPQILFPNGSTMSWPGQSSGAVTPVWSVSAVSFLDCPLRCSNTACQGFMYQQDRRICQLMKFAAVPYSLSSQPEDFYVRF